MNKRANLWRETAGHQQSQMPVYLDVNCFIKGIKAPSFLTFLSCSPPFHTHAHAHLHQGAHPAHRPAVAGAAPDAEHRSQDDHKDGAHHCQEDPHIVIWLGEIAERERVIVMEGAAPIWQEHGSPGSIKIAKDPLESSSRGDGVGGTCRWGQVVLSVHGHL